MTARITVPLLVLAACGVLLSACGSDEEPGAGPPAQPAEPATPEPPAPEPSPAPESAQPPAAAQVTTPDALPRGIVLSLAQFVREGGKPVPGPARLEFLVRRNGAWEVESLEDPESNVFHKAMVYPGADGPVLLTMAGTEAVVKKWVKTDAGLEPTTLWKKDFGGKFSRMRDAEIADLDGDGAVEIAVATHDQGVVAILDPDGEGGFAVEEIDELADTFVHEIEIGDLDGDGVPEVYATPSEPNRLDGSPQEGHVVRYVPGKDEGRVVVADLGQRHAKEILVDDVDGDGRDELYVAVEGHVEERGGTKELVEPVEIRRYQADTPPDEGEVIAVIDDRLCRFLTAGDLDGDGGKELVAATFSSGVWMFHPSASAPWQGELIDADSAGFEHAAILTDLDGDGVDELYVASDKHKQLRRYVWDGSDLARETIYSRPDDRPIFTWNLMPFPTGLTP